MPQSALETGQKGIQNSTFAINKHLDIKGYCVEFARGLSPINPGLVYPPLGKSINCKLLFDVFFSCLDPNRQDILFRGGWASGKFR
jgi:hypothetical protein